MTVKVFDDGTDLKGSGGPLLRTGNRVGVGRYEPKSTNQTKKPHPNISYDLS